MPGPTQGYVTVEGGRLYYEASGQGRQVVLLHPGPGDLELWTPQVPTLEARYRVIRYDARGFGKSDLPTGPFAHFEDLRRLLDALELKRASLVGLSLGGRTALDFALAYPDRTDRLILANAGISGYQPKGLERYQRAFDEAKERNDVAGMAEVIATLWVDGPHRGPTEVDPGLRENYKNLWMRHRRRRGSAEWTLTELEPPALERLGEIRASTLIVLAELDQPSIAEQADLLRNGIPNSEFLVIPGAAHFVTAERPAEFNRAVIRFLAQSS